MHHDNGVVGAACFKESEFRRIRILKEQGFSAIRVSHNPASTAMIEACDFYGIDVFVKADSVELIVNGKSIGKKKIKNYQAFFKTKFFSGTIEAIAYDENGKEMSREKMTSAQKANVVISPEKESYSVGEIAYVNILIADKNGNVECNDDRDLSIEIIGGELLGFGSANPCTEEDFLSGTYSTYYGRAQAVIRVENENELAIKVRDGNNIVEKIFVK